MKITMLSYYDWTGSGYRLSQAINQHSDHTVEFFSERYRVFFNHPHNTRYISDDVIAVQNHIDSSDIVHIKGDYPPTFIEDNTGLVLGHKPIVQTVSGSHFRKKEFGGTGRYKPFMYDRCALRTSFEPDLLYDDYRDSVLTPYPIDCLDKPILWKEQETLTFSHFPSRARVKGTAFILEVFKKLKDFKKFNLIIETGTVDYHIAMEQKKQSSIYFDQFMVGAYGNSTIEMMQYGIPVACWLNHDTNNPILTTDLNVDKWVEMLLQINNLKEISDETKRFCDKTHSYQSVATQWSGLYENIG